MTEVSLDEPITISDAELAHIEEEPVKLFPENQDSNFGLFRRIVCERYTDVANQIQTIYNEKWSFTSSTYLAFHEYQVGLPIYSNISLSIRRALVHIRYLRGPFTRDFRSKVIEFFIELSISGGLPATFGTLGISIGSGIPLYSGVGGAPTDYYYVVEDIANFSYTVYVDATIGVSTTLLRRELEHVTPAGITFTIALYYPMRGGMKAKTKIGGTQTH